METKALADLLRAIANLVEDPDQKNLAKLTRELSQAKTPTRRSEKKISRQEPDRESLMETVRDRLLDAKTREDGYKVLDDNRLSHREMLAIARSAQVHVSKNETVNSIKERLVETIVGAQINARAIRGYD